MPDYFLDSSALVKRYRFEIGSSWLAKLLPTSDRIVVSRLAHVEVSSAIIRRSRRGGVNAEEVAAALAALDRDMQEIYEVIELQGPVCADALKLARTHALRAADAIQLACALLAAPAPLASSQYVLVSADDDLNAAAAMDGLGVENPNLHP